MVNEIDFRKDKAKAKKEVEKRSEKWKIFLSKEQKELLDNPSQFKNINNELEKYRGVDDIKNNDIKNEVDLLDKALTKRAAKLDKKHFIYAKLKGEDIGFIQNSIYDPNTNSIIGTQVDKIRDGFKYGIIHNFMSGNLSQQRADGDSPILIRLEVDQGTRMGYLKDDQIFIERDQGIVVNNRSKISVITDNGMQILKIKAKLVPKADVKDKITENENRLNKDFNKITKIKKIKIIKFLVDGFYSSHIISKSDTLFRQLLNVMPNFKKVLANMDKGGAITFKDQPDMKSQGKEKGAYDTASKSLWIQINHDDHLKDDEDRKTLFRLVGSAYDHLVFENQSTSSNFNVLYNDEKDKVKMDGSIKSNPSDFFAGVFSYLFTPDAAISGQIEKEAPQTCAFIKDICKETKNPEELKAYLVRFNNVPLNCITKKEARQFGWKGGDLHRYADNMSIGGDVFGNRAGNLPPLPPGHVYYEIDNDYKGGSRGEKRWVFSKDENNKITAIYETSNHYLNLKKIYPN